MRNQCFEWHKRGFTPYSYHTEDGKRHQHYMATAWCTFSMSVPFATALSLFSFIKIFNPIVDSDATQQWIGAIGLLVTAAELGVIVGGLHLCINHYRGIKNRSNYSVQVNSIESEEGQIELDQITPAVGEATGLLGKTQEGASLYRLGNCHPLHLIYPATPLKTGLWISIAGLFIFTLANLVNPNLFSEYTGHLYIVNGTNCTTMNSTTVDSDLLSNNTVQSICGIGFGILTGSFALIFLGFLLISAATTGAAVASHYLSAKAVEACQAEEINDDQALCKNFHF